MAFSSCGPRVPLGQLMRRPSHAPPARSPQSELRADARRCARDAGLPTLAETEGFLISGVVRFAGLRASLLCAAASRLMGAEIVGRGVYKVFPDAVCIVGGEEFSDCDDTVLQQEQEDDDEQDTIFATTSHKSAVSTLLLHDGSQRELAKMPTARSHCTVASVGSLLFALGGEEAGCAQASNALEVLDTEAGTWRSLPPWPRPQLHAAAGFLSNKLVVTGGCSSKPSSCTAFTAAYGLKSRQWSVLAPMPTARCHAAAAVIEGELYVAGGRDGKRVVPCLQRFSVSSNTSGYWARLPDMPTAREKCFAVASGGYLIVGGGAVEHTRCECRITNAVESYEVSTATWHTVERMPVRKEASAAACVAGKVMVFGGVSWWEDLEAKDGNIFIHPGETANPWVRGPPLQGIAVGIAAAVVKVF